MWTSDVKLDSDWFGVVPIFVQSGGVPVNARLQHELTTECRRNVSLVCTVLEQSTEMSMPAGFSKVLRCRGTNRGIGSVQLAGNARLLTDEGCSLSVLDVHKRSKSRLVRFFRLVRSLSVRYLRLVRFFRLVRSPAWLQVPDSVRFLITTANKEFTR